MADPNPSHFNEELETANEPLIAEEDDNYEEEDDTEDDYEEEDDEENWVSDEEEEEEDDEDDEEEFPLAVESPPRVPDSGPVSIGDGEMRRVDEGEESCLLSGQWNRSEIDGLFCSICMDAWTNKGDHHISCLPCGHIYGLSCIKKWLQRCRSPGKCPQCNQKCSLKDVRKLFASRIVAVDEESQKRIRSLEAKCASFEKKGYADYDAASTSSKLDQILAAVQDIKLDREMMKNVKERVEMLHTRVDFLEAKMRDEVREMRDEMREMRDEMRDQREDTAAIRKELDLPPFKRKRPVGSTTGISISEAQFIQRAAEEAASNKTEDEVACLSKRNGHQ
ncbi:hypothetical protein LWI28_018330 [Acer negundo]|uniref:RING-type domain-containing protein n=1 Tax=Acer negundo TaxID=4023 RepID=A0AAD5I6M3_ACENE|nr:hypothetical protein LWI28_018330 [Acer negundo]